MVKRLLIFSLFIAFPFKIMSQSFSDEKVAGVWNGSINPIFYPLEIMPGNSYCSNILFPGIMQSDSLNKELAAGFTSNSFQHLFLNFQNVKEKVAFGARLYNLYFDSKIEDDEHEYNYDSSAYLYDDYKYEYFSLSIDGFINSKRIYQTGLSIKAGMERDSSINDYGKYDLNNKTSDYYNLRSEKSINYNFEGTFLQRAKRCSKKTFFIVNGEIDNVVSNIDYYKFDKSESNPEYDHYDSNFVEIYDFEYMVKAGVLRFRDGKRLTGLFIGTEYNGHDVKDNGSDSLNQYMLKLGLMKDELYRTTYNKRKIFLEGIYSRKLNFNNVVLYFGHNILAGFGISGSDSLNVMHNDSSFISLNYTMPLLFQFNIKDVVTLHSAYSLKLLFEYLSKVDIDGIEQKLEDYQKTPECDFRFATTPIALTVNLKDRLQFSFVPSFNYSGVFVYKGELRYLF